MSRFGRQPARVALFNSGYKMCHAAELIGVTPGHLRAAIGGYVRPMDAIREELPALIGVPLSELFMPEVLAKPYDASKNPWAGL